MRDGLSILKIKASSDGRCNRNHLNASSMEERMKTKFWVEFQEIHKHIVRTIWADDMDAASTRADEMLPEIVAGYKWLPEHASVSRISTRPISR